VLCRKPNLGRSGYQKLRRERRYKYVLFFTDNQTQVVGLRARVYNPVLGKAR
jgi:hypothetical protein